MFQVISTSAMAMCASQDLVPVVTITILCKSVSFRPSVLQIIPFFASLQLESILLQLIICWRRVTREEMLQKSCRRGIESPFKVTYLKFTALGVKGLRYLSVSVNV